MFPGEQVTNGRLQIFDANLPEFQLQATGLDIEGAPTPERWRAAGEQLMHLNRVTKWALGDWINYGKSRREWGNKYEDSLDALDLEPTQVRQYSMVSEGFSRDRRHWPLRWSYYRDVVNFEPDIQDRLLTLATEQRWTSVELRNYGTSGTRHGGRAASGPRASTGLFMRTRLGPTSPERRDLGTRSKRTIPRCPWRTSRH